MAKAIPIDFASILKKNKFVNIHENLNGLSIFPIGDSSCFYSKNSNPSLKFPVKNMIYNYIFINKIFAVQQILPSCFIYDLYNC